MKLLNNTTHRPRRAPSDYEVSLEAARQHIAAQDRIIERQREAIRELVAERRVADECRAITWRSVFGPVRRPE